MICCDLRYRHDCSHAVLLLDAGLLFWDELLPSQVTTVSLARLAVSLTGLPSPFSLPLVRCTSRTGAGFEPISPWTGWIKLSLE